MSGSDWPICPVPSRVGVQYHEDHRDVRSVSPHIPKPSSRSHPDLPPSYQEILPETPVPSSPMLDDSIHDHDGWPDTVLRPLPPLYDDIIHNERPFASHPEDARAWQDMRTVCSEMFSKGATYWRLCLVVGSLTGLSLMLFYLLEDDQEWKLTVGSVMFAVFYMFYLVDVFVGNSNMAFLTNVISVAELNKHMERVRAGVPSIVWHMKCNQKVQRTRIMGGTIETYTDETIWKGTRAFRFTHWEDFSSDRQLDNIGVYKMTRIKFFKRYVLADSWTTSAFEQQRKAFIKENKWRDKHYTLEEVFDIVGSKPAVLVSTTSEKPFFFQRCWYVLAALFFLELPFSFMMRMQSTRLHYTYVKYLR
ncbi:uncharacterized protein LOC129596829 [Paramacrobiotus metropolitanus]|uniref:uncharacterized protein LOC129596829 n=1 Tax=Paramacrobiotus metropolitanus TaxID=2943436 RepID=UPI002445BE9B|nr:uncharacterized protein LOC129596829 [Paramacrobiotus metropolitanus]